MSSFRRCRPVRVLTALYVSHTRTLALFCHVLRESTVSLSQFLFICALLFARFWTYFLHSGLSKSTSGFVYRSCWQRTRSYLQSPPTILATTSGKIAVDICSSSLNTIHPAQYQPLSDTASSSVVATLSTHVLTLHVGVGCSAQGHRRRLGSTSDRPNSAI